VVLPIPKVAVPVKFWNYRPISLLACLSKVFEVLMARQMEAHIRRNELLTVFQSGFRRHHSTTAAVLNDTEDIRLNMEDGQITVLVFLDLSRAFDMVIHGLLLCKLRNLQNYSDGARMLVDSYLNGRTQFMRCGAKESPVERVTCGVPQGSFLDPLLFVSDINDISRVIKYSRFHIYADHLQIYHSSIVFRINKGVMMR
jgi:small basic protein